MTTLPASVREYTVLPAPVGAGPHLMAAAGITAGDVWKIIRRRIGLVVLMWILCMAITAVGTYVWLKKWPTYRASAFINVESTIPEAPFEGLWNNPVLVKDQVERALRDQAVLIKSDEVLNRALADEQVQGTLWWDRQMGKRAEYAMITLKDDLAAVPMRDSSIIQVAYATRDRNDAPVIVNTVVRHYLNRLDEIVRRGLRDERDRLAREVEEATRVLNTQIQQIADYQATQAAIPGIMQQMTVVTDTLMRLGAMRTESRARLQALRAQFDAYQQAGPANVPVTPEIMMLVENDPQIMSLDMRHMQLAEQKQVLLDKFGEEHRDVRAFDVRIELVKNELQTRRLQKIDEYRQMQMDRVRLDMLAAQDQVAQIEQEYRQAEAAQTDLDRKRAHLQMLDDQKTRGQERLDTARKALEAMTYVTNKPRPVRVELLQDASKPLERASPRWEVTLSAGAVLGVILGAGLALLLELLNTAVRTPQDVVRHTAIPVLGMIPVLDDEEVRIDNIELATRLAPRSLVAECFRRVRTNLLFSCPPDRQRTVLVTSAQPEEGKTAIAVNLAVAQAQSGRKILLVDCNFRRPALYRAFPQLKQDGLSSLLIGQGTLRDLVSPTEIGTLEILAAGPTPPNPAELVGSTYFRAFLSEAAEQYDQVILDGPPGLLVSDALVLAAAVDGVIVVCHAARTSRGALRRLRDTLDRVGAHVLGVVLNAAETQAGGYFKKMYRTYYDYDEQAMQVLPSLTAAEQPGTGPPANEAK